MNAEEPPVNALFYALCAAEKTDVPLGAKTQNGFPCRTAGVQVETSGSISVILSSDAGRLQAKSDRPRSETSVGDGLHPVVTSLEERLREPAESRRLLTNTGVPSTSRKSRAAFLHEAGRSSHDRCRASRKHSVTPVRGKETPTKAQY